MSATAKLMLQAMAMEAYNTGEIAISCRVLANLCGANKSTVQPAIKQLIDGKLIDPLNSPVQGVQRYKLLHPRYAKRVDDPEKANTIITAHKWLRCPQCKNDRPGLLKIGICRSCNYDNKLDRKISRKVDERLADLYPATSSGVA